MSTLLSLVVENPEPGKVLRRLVGDVTTDEAARVYRAGVMDLCQRFSDLNVRSRVMLYGPRGTRKQVSLLASRSWRLIQRKGDDRGETLIDLAERSFRGGHRRVLALWPTAPTLPAEFVLNAFDQLLVDDVVIGPMSSGDVYAVGFSVDMPHVFQGFDWSDSATVFDRLVERVERLGLVMGLLPHWYDLDASGGLDTLWSHVRAQIVADGHAVTPRLAEVLRKMMASREPGAAGD